MFFASLRSSLKITGKLQFPGLCKRPLEAARNRKNGGGWCTSAKRRPYRHLGYGIGEGEGEGKILISKTFWRHASDDVFFKRMKRWQTTLKRYLASQLSNATTGRASHFCTPPSIFLHIDFQETSFAKKLFDSCIVVVCTHLTGFNRSNDTHFMYISTQLVRFHSNFY